MFFLLMDLFKAGLSSNTTYTTLEAESNMVKRFWNSIHAVVNL